jgi:hypothetical protein
MSSDRSQSMDVLARGSVPAMEYGAAQSTRVLVKPRLLAEGSSPIHRRGGRAERSSSEHPPRPSTLSYVEEIESAFDALVLGGMQPSADLGSRPVRAATARRFADGDLGQATSHAARHLICDLASPLAVGSEPRYRLGPPGAMRPSPDCLYQYRWTLRRRKDNAPVWQTVTAAPDLRLTAAARGRYLMEVDILADGTSTGICLSLDHDVEAEPALLTTVLRGASPVVAQAVRELLIDFRRYIIDAAAATGPDGITARFLAAILVIEILRRPKEARESDLDEIDALLDTMEHGEPPRGSRPFIDPAAAPPHDSNALIDRPLGVSQMRLMTAAMVTGATEWIDEDIRDRRPARDRIKTNFDALPLAAKRAIFTQLRWPKSSIAMAAKLLATLKNRPNRYPELSGAKLAADLFAVGIVATEFASGRIGTPAPDTSPSSYASWVWRQMKDPLVQRFFPDD